MLTIFSNPDLVAFYLPRGRNLRALLAQGIDYISTFPRLFFKSCNFVGGLSQCGNFFANNF